MSEIDRIERAITNVEFGGREDDNEDGAIDKAVGLLGSALRDEV